MATRRPVIMDVPPSTSASTVLNFDECDNLITPVAGLSPELSKFPSGVDGEQMHTLLDFGISGHCGSSLRTTHHSPQGPAKCLRCTLSFRALQRSVPGSSTVRQGTVNSAVVCYGALEVRDAPTGEVGAAPTRRRAASRPTATNAILTRWKQMDCKKNNANELCFRLVVEARCRGDHWLAHADHSYSRFSVFTLCCRW